MGSPRAVLDTNVVVSALRSRGGASYRLLTLADSDLYDLCVSVPLLLEYEDILRRPGMTSLGRQQVEDILDYLVSVAVRTDIHFLWRPTLRDPKDELVLELAVAAGCQCIVSFNTRDFLGSEHFGVEVCEPRAFLGKIGALP